MAQINYYNEFFIPLIDRSLTTTKKNIHGLKRELQRHYPIKITGIDVHKRLPEHNSFCYEIMTRESSYFLKAIEPEGIKSLEWERDLYQLGLKQIPQLHPTIDGQLSILFHDRDLDREDRYALYQYRPMKQMCDYRNRHQKTALGNAVANFHHYSHLLARKNLCRQPFVNSPYTSRQSLSRDPYQVEELYKYNSNHDLKEYIKIMEKIKKKLDQLDAAKLYIHNDWCLLNVSFNRDTVETIYDTTQMAYDFRMIDVAQAITRFSLFDRQEGTIDIQSMKNFITAYRDGIYASLALSAQELTHLNVFLVYSLWGLLDYLMRLTQKLDLRTEFIKFTRKMIDAAWLSPVLIKDKYVGKVV
jgi:Ser/Thr protein kinase RdoA (MazF antagonist)